MKFTLKNVVVSIFALFIISSCTKENIGKNPNDQELYFSFKTPDWERTIPCDKIDFLPTNEISDGIAFVVASSASTNATFGFPFPADSSAMVQSTNLKKYNISDYGSGGSTDEKKFEISLKLNKTGISDTNRIISVAGYSDDNYNEITSIEYIGSESNYANFRVKGNYKMNMIDISKPEEHIKVSGSYCIKFRTNKK